MQVFRGETINNSERLALLGNQRNTQQDEEENENENKIDMKSFLTACAANLVTSIYSPHSLLLFTKSTLLLV